MFPLAVPNLHPDSVDCSYDGQLLFNSDAELFDSATSLSKERKGIQLVTDLLNHISKVVYMGFADTGPKGNKLTHAKEVLLNAELIFRNAALHDPNGNTDFSLSQFLIYELETLARVLRENFGHPIFVDDTKDGNQLKGFLFDCMIEYLDSRYGLYCKSGFTAWSRMTRCMTSDKLIGEIAEQIRMWMCWAGMIPDEIIEMEMSHPFGKSTDLEIEEFEKVADIERDLLQILVDEIAVDLCGDKLCCFGISSSS